MTAIAAASTNAPLDWRHRIPAAAFQKTADGEWVSPVVPTPFAFAELIYAWHLHRPGDTFRLYLKAGFGPNDETDWLYAGCWGAVTNRVARRERPAFDRGVLDLDWLKLKTKATRFQVKVVAAGAEPLLAPPELSAIATDNHPPTGPADTLTTTNAASHPPVEAAAERRRGRVLDVPLRRQFDSRGVRMVDRCQSAALASALEYYGKSVPLEAITQFTFDPEYHYPGIWPRVIGAAREFGFEGYLERFRDWDQVRQALAENKVILCSMRMRAGDCASPPYAEMGNHIVALCGVTDDGRVVVTDSALGKSGQGYLCQWKQSDFETVWMRTKGGIAMVICPPAGAVERLVNPLPPFPKDRAFPAGDDH